MAAIGAYNVRTYCFMDAILSMAEEVISLRQRASAAGSASRVLQVQLNAPGVCPEVSIAVNITLRRKVEPPGKTIQPTSTGLMVSCIPDCWSRGSAFPLRRTLAASSLVTTSAPVALLQEEAQTPYIVKDYSCVAPLAWSGCSTVSAIQAKR